MPFIITRQMYTHAYSLWRILMNGAINGCLNHHIMRIQPTVNIFWFKSWSNYSAEKKLVLTMKSSPKQAPILKTGINSLVWKGSKNWTNFGRYNWSSMASTLNNDVLSLLKKLFNSKSHEHINQPSWNKIWRKKLSILPLHSMW